MKKLLFILVCMLGIATTMETTAQIFGVKAGLNLSTLRFESDNTDLQMKPGFHAGPTVEFPASEFISLETGLLLSSKGVKFDADEMEDARLSLLYLDIPLTGKAYFNAGGARVFGQFGPYAGIGVSGKWKMDDMEEDIEWGSEGDFNRLDFGLIAGAGVDLNNLQIGLNYSFGLANISTGDGDKVSNGVLGISVGYKFSSY